MRVCDITREDEVVSAYTIVRHQPGESASSALAAGTATSVVEFETGKRADEALSKGNWSELGRLIPYGLRPKDPNRTAGAKKAQATRAAKKAAAAEEAAAATASQGDATSGSTPAVAAPAAAAPAPAPAGVTKTPAKA